MDTRKQQINTFTSNLALVQVQAIGVSLAASFLTIITSLSEGTPFNIYRVISLMLTAIATASAASLILSTLMVLLAILARKWKINPDNVATPIAAMLGDVTTLSFMVCYFLLKNTFFYYTFSRFYLELYSPELQNLFL